MRASSLLFRWVFLIAALSIGGWLAFAQAANEHDSVLHALSLSYGPSIDKRHPRFRIAPDHFLVPTFSSDGVLILISIEPRRDHDPTRAFGMSKMEFDSVLATLSSIKPLQGTAEDNGFRERSGWRTHKRVVYGNAYLQTAELMGEGDPAPIESAKIYYIRPVTGVPKIGADEKPDGRVIASCVSMARTTLPARAYSSSCGLTLRNGKRSTSPARPTRVAPQIKEFMNTSSEQ